MLLTDAEAADLAKTIDDAVAAFAFAVAAVAAVAAFAGANGASVEEIAVPPSYLRPR